MLVAQECSAQIVAQGPGSCHNDPSVDELVIEVGVIGVVCREWDFWVDEGKFWEEVRLEVVGGLDGVASQDNVCAEGLEGSPQVSPARQEDCIPGVRPYHKLVTGDAPAQCRASITALPARWAPPFLSM